MAITFRKFLESVELLLWLLLLAGTPLFIMPRAYESFLLPKVFWAESLITLLLVCNLSLTWLGRPYVLPLSPILALLGAYAALHCASMAWAQSVSLAADESQWWVMLLLAALLFPSAFTNRRKRLHYLGAALLFSAVATALWALYDDVMQAWFPARLGIVNKLGDWRGYLAAGFGNTSHIGDFLSLMFTFAMLVFLQARRRSLRVLAFVAVGLLLAGLIVVLSVHSDIGLILGFILATILMARCYGVTWFARRWKALALAAGLCAAVFAFFAFDLPGNPHRPGIFQQAMASSRLAFGWPSRIFIWETGLNIARDHPWLGVGSGNFCYAFPWSHSPLALANPAMRDMAGIWTNAAHNELIQSWAEVGIAGPALLILLVALAYRALGKNLRAADDFDRTLRIATLAALTAFVVHAQMNFPLEIATGGLFFVLMLSLAAITSPDGGWAQFRMTNATGKGKWAVAVALAVSVALAGRQIEASVAKIDSDMIYRQAHESNALWQQALLGGADPAQTEALARRTDALFQQALALWPRHQNARSEYSEFLVREGHGREALPQIRLTLQRLQSWELYLRRARAQWEAGQQDEARRSVAKAFAMRPAEGTYRPALAAWASGFMPANRLPPPPGKGLPTELWSETVQPPPMY